MSQHVSIVSDVKTAAVLAGSAGLLGAVTVPFLLPSAFELVPPEQRTLPLPLPLFCVVLAIQFLIVYGLFALAGLRLARARNREPAPLLSAIWTNRLPNRIGSAAGLAFATGMLCGLALIGAVALIRRVLPQTLPDILHPPSFSGALLASATASLGEEILCQLFLCSAFLRVLPVSGKSTVLAVLVSSLLFAVWLAPAAVFLFGGFHNVPHLCWQRISSPREAVALAKSAPEKDGGCNMRTRRCSLRAAVGHTCVGLLHGVRRGGPIDRSIRRRLQCREAPATASRSLYSCHPRAVNGYL